MPDITEILKANLTDDQFRAATDSANEILCLACAGSGKSRTLAYRIARLIAEGDSADSIVAFTFTEKAAESIKRRVSEALLKSGMDPSMLGAMYIGTIHGYCKFLLGEMDAKYRQFDVLDPNKLKLYLISRYASLGLYNVRRQRTAIRVQANPNAYSQGYYDTINNISDAWANMNDECLNIDDLTRENEELGNVLKEIYIGLNADQYIDYSLMIRLIDDALDRNDNKIIRVISKVKHLMVDEYQDVNPAQEKLISGIHNIGSTLFVVGDDDQAIYAWRGADVNNILNFQRRYPNSTLHTLSINFRSSKTIIDASSGFISRQLSAQRISKSPVPSPDNINEPNQVGKFFFENRLEEANWIAQRIQFLIGKSYKDGDITRGLCPSDFAILMRSTNTEESDGTQRHTAYTQALESLGIKSMVESQGSIFNYSSVQVIRNAFELLRNNDLDRTKLTDFYNTEVLPIFTYADFDKLSAVMTEWQRLIHEPISGARRKVKPQELLHHLLNAFNIQNSNFDDIEMHALGVFSKIMQDIESVYVSIDTTGRFTEILNFLRNVAEGSYETSPDTVIQRPNAVFVSTIHGAKGLEFPVVFVVDVQTGRFPGSRSSYRGWLPQSLLQNALNRGAYQNNREGEIRLFYTAVTRAERYLYITGCKLLPGGIRENRVSVFTSDLTDENITEENTFLPASLTETPQQQRFDESIMPTTFSEIKYYLVCPKNYQFRKQYGFNPHVPDLYGYGQTVHTSIAKLHELFTSSPPTAAETETITRETFNLKHVPESNDPINHPGPFERAQDKAVEVVTNYTQSYQSEFTTDRQIEVRFEIPASQTIITGAIDLLLKKDETGNITEATVVDFKSLEKPDDDSSIDWVELSIQVQLYAKAANKVLGQNAKTGAVHLLRNNERINIPIDDNSINCAIENIEWAVDRIINRDFPMRPEATKCENCDFTLLCSKSKEEFQTSAIPPAIFVPASITTEPILVKSFSQVD